MPVKLIEWLRTLFNRQKHRPLDEPGYRALLENIPAITYINDLAASNDTLYISPQASRLLGYPREAFMLDPGLWIKRLHPDDHTRVIEEAERTNATLEPFSMDYRLIARDGHIVWVHDDAVVARDADGQPQYWLGVWADISERKQIEAAEQASEERYHSFITQTTEGIRRYDLDEPIPIDMPEDGQLARMLKHMYIAECNDAFAHMYGLASADELIGKRLGEMGLENDPKNIEALRSFIRSKYKVLDAEAHEFDAQGNEKIFLINTIGIVEAGYLKRVWGTQRDITERKKSELALRQREMILAAITFAAERFLTVSDWRQNIDIVLERLGQGLEVSHAYIFEHRTVNEERRSTLRYEWTAPGQTSDLGKALYLDMPVRDPNGDVSYDLLKSGQPFVGDRPHLSDEDRAYFQGHGIKAVLEMPIFVAGLWWGTIGLDDCVNDQVWTDSEVDLLKVAASLISAAIQRSQADEEIHKFNAALEQRIADLDAINQISHTLVIERDLKTLIQAVGEQIRIMYNATVVYIALLDPETNMIDFYYQYEQGRFFENTQIKYGEGMTSRVMQLRRPVLINSNWEQEAKSYGVIRKGEPSKCSLTVPLMLGDEAIGTISLQDLDRENIYTEDHIRQLTTIAANLAVAIENARLHSKLQAELIERRQAEETVRTLNATLEQRVKERTALLESANKELETFSYSVSHDLRAPLRAVQSFSNLLVREHSAGLDAEGRGFLERVIYAASEMNEKIEGLLAFARLTRAGLHPTALNLSALATHVIETLRAAHPDRNVTVHIEAGLTARGDEILIRTVLENLLGNAWKYSAKQPAAVIEFGAALASDFGQEDAGEGRVFFVRDNGAGFNMKYANKLFGAFQRLHRVDEFPGHGIGLATVQRIIHRHGGRIWAEGEVGKGATFYFTLA